MKISVFKTHFKKHFVLDFIFIITAIYKTHFVIHFKIIISTHFTKHILIYILYLLSGHTSQNRFCFILHVHYQDAFHKIHFILYFMFIIRTHFTKYTLFYILCSLSGLLHKIYCALHFMFIHHHHTLQNTFCLYTSCSLSVPASTVFSNAAIVTLRKLIRPVFYFKFNFSKSSFTIFVYINKSRNTKKLSCKKRKNFF